MLGETDRMIGGEMLFDSVNLVFSFQGVCTEIRHVGTFRMLFISQL